MRASGKAYCQNLYIEDIPVHFLPVDFGNVSAHATDNVFRKDVNHVNLNSSRGFIPHNLSSAACTVLFILRGFDIV